MLGLSLGQEVLLAVFIGAALVVIGSRGNGRVSAATGIFSVTLLSALILFDLSPAVLGFFFPGSAGFTADYVLFDVLLTLIAILAYAFASREYRLHKVIARQTRNHALAEVAPKLRDLGRVPEGLTRVVILITARNEEDTIGQVLASLPQRIGTFEFVKLVVDDGSSDNTRQIAEESGAITLTHGVSLGVGAPITTGLVAALRVPCSYVIHMDADGQHSPGDMMRVLAPLVEGGADMVLASRFKDTTPTHLSLTRKLGIRFYTRLVNRLSGLSLTDTTSGYFAVRTDSIPDVLFHAEKNFAVEFMIRAGRNHVRVSEVAVVQLPRGGGRSQFDNLSMFFLYHLRVLGQVVSAYSSSGPRYPGLPQDWREKIPPPRRSSANPILGSEDKGSPRYSASPDE